MITAISTGRTLELEATDGGVTAHMELDLHDFYLASDIW